MTSELSGKRALVTGAGKGIGRTIVQALVQAGAEVMALSRTKDDLVTLQAETGCHTLTVDLADANATVAAATTAGAMDLLVNNAGISIPQAFLATDLEAWEATFAVNVRAALLVSQVVARGMVARGTGGAIVMLSSQASQVGIADHTAYCASKGALDQLTRVMALELGPQGIRVNAVNPTVVLTPMGEMAWADPAKRNPMLAKIPLGHFAVPQDVAHAVLFLLSDAARMITGVTLPVDGGFLAT